MLKQSLIYLLLSILVVLLANYAHHVIAYIQAAFAYIYYHLSPFLGSSSWGPSIRKILILVLLPIVIAGIPALIYRLIKGQHMPHFIVWVWIVWIVIALSNILLVH